MLTPIYSNQSTKTSSLNEIEAEALARVTGWYL